MDLVGVKYQLSFFIIMIIILSRNVKPIQAEFHL